MGDGNMGDNCSWMLLNSDEHEQRQQEEQEMWICQVTRENLPELDRLADELRRHCDEFYANGNKEAMQWIQDLDSNAMAWDMAIDSLGKGEKLRREKLDSDESLPRPEHGHDEKQRFLLARVVHMQARNGLRTDERSMDDVFMVLLSGKPQPAVAAQLYAAIAAIWLRRLMMDPNMVLHTSLELAAANSKLIELASREKCSLAEKVLQVAIHVPAEATSLVASMNASCFAAAIEAHTSMTTAKTVPGSVEQQSLPSILERIAGDAPSILQTVRRIIADQTAPGCATYAPWLEPYLSLTRNWVGLLKEVRESEEQQSEEHRKRASTQLHRDLMLLGRIGVIQDIGSGLLNPDIASVAAEAFCAVAELSSSIYAPLVISQFSLLEALKCCARELQKNIKGHVEQPIQRASSFGDEDNTSSSGVVEKLMTVTLKNVAAAFTRCLASVASVHIPHLLYNASYCYDDIRDVLLTGIDCLVLPNLEIKQNALEAFYALIGHYAHLQSDGPHQHPALAVTPNAMPNDARASLEESVGGTNLSSDEDSVPTDNWITVQAQRRKALIPFFQPFVEQLVKTVIPFPENVSLLGDSFDLEGWMRFRDEASLNVTDATLIVGCESLLEMAGNELLHWVNCSTTERPSPVPWSRVDTCLFTLTAIAPRSPAGKDMVIPTALKLLPQICYPDETLEGIILRTSAAKFILWSAGFVGSQRMLTKDLLALLFNFVTEIHTGVPLHQHKWVGQALRQAEFTIVECISAVLSAAARGLVSVEENDYGMPGAGSEQINPDNNVRTDRDSLWIMEQVAQLVSNTSVAIQNRSAVLIGLGAIIGSLPKKNMMLYHRELLNALAARWDLAEKDEMDDGEENCCKLFFIALECLRFGKQSSVELNTYCQELLNTYSDKISNSLVFDDYHADCCGKVILKFVQQCTPGQQKDTMRTQALRMLLDAFAVKPSIQHIAVVNSIIRGLEHTLAHEVRELIVQWLFQLQGVIAGQLFEADLSSSESDFCGIAIETFNEVLNNCQTAVVALCLGIHSTVLSALARMKDTFDDNLITGGIVLLWRLIMWATYESPLCTDEEAANEHCNPSGIACRQKAVEILQDPTIRMTILDVVEKASRTSGDQLKEWKPLMMQLLCKINGDDERTASEISTDRDKTGSTFSTSTEDLGCGNSL